MDKEALIPMNLKPWIDARRRFRLSHAHVQMARELGMNPKKLGKLANHDQEPWKRPLQEFIAALYAKRFGKARPDTVKTIEEMAAAKRAKKQRSKAKQSTFPNESPAHHQIASAVICKSTEPTGG